MRLLSTSIGALILGVLFLAACGSDPHNEFTPPVEPDLVDASNLCIEPGASQCRGLDYQVCVEGRWYTTESCDAPTPFCDPSSGCTACEPDTRFCGGRDVYLCSSEGTSAELVDSCGAGQECLFGACYDSCALARGTNSYLGCDFLSIPTLNFLAEDFAEDFAVVATNPHEEDSATVTAYRAGSLLAQEVIPPGGTQALMLPYLLSLQDGGASRISAQGAFEVRSDLPIAAYQYNPLHFELGSGLEPVSSFTNDASLLLPEHVLSGSYMVSTWPSLGLGDFPGEATWLPGYVAVTATVDGTSVTLKPQANTQAGDISPIEIGSELVVDLNRGDVLQLLAEIPENDLQTNVCLLRGGEQAGNGADQSCLDSVLGDLTGTTIEASSPVAVVAGHRCTFMPFDRYACDHLEEMMFPRETWGRSVFMTAPASPDGRSPVATQYRVLSGDTANYITFTPPVHDPVQLHGGEFIDFLSAEDILIEGTAPLYVTQTMLGEQALATSAGDPAMGSGIPLSQWRSSYDFLVPETYSSNWLNLAGPVDAEVYLDGLRVEDWEVAGGTGFKAARIEVAPGSHHIESAGQVGFGITSYGYASYTSYLLPGGMNFLR